MPIGNTGISEQGIDRLMIDILNYCEKCNSIMNDISSIVDETRNYFTGYAGDKFRQNYSLISNEYSTLKNNILSYNSDLLSVKNQYIASVDDAVTMIKDAQGNVENIN